MVTDEAQALSTVIAHLQDQFPQVPAQAIADEARSVFREYDRASVRAFLPILVGAPGRRAAPAARLHRRLTAVSASQGRSGSADLDQVLGLRVGGERSRVEALDDQPYRQNHFLQCQRDEQDIGQGGVGIPRPQE